MLGKEFGHVISFPVDDNPAGALAVVFCDLLTSQFGVHVVLSGWYGGVERMRCEV